jgi:hypothetical protein
MDSLRCLSAGRQEAYDNAIDGAPEFIDPPELELVRMVEQGDVVMAELSGTARRAAGGEMRMSSLTALARLAAATASLFDVRQDRCLGGRARRGGDPGHRARRGAGSRLT